MNHQVTLMFIDKIYKNKYLTDKNHHQKALQKEMILHKKYLLMLWKIKESSHRKVIIIKESNDVFFFSAP